MRTVRFSDGYEIELQSSINEKYSMLYKNRLREFFNNLINPDEAKYYRKRMYEKGLKLTNVKQWSKIKADASTSIPGDSLEQLSDALGIPMRDLKYRE